MASPEHHPSNRGLLLGIFCLLAVILLAGTFFVGMQIGMHRASLRAIRSMREAGFPQEIIREMRPGFPLPPGNGQQMGRHGFGGEVLGIRREQGELTVARRNGMEGIIHFTEDTPVLSPGTERSLDDITVGANIIAIGQPAEDGTIQARMLLLPKWQ